MNDTNYLFMHGRVHDIVKASPAPDAHILSLELDRGRLMDLAIGKFDHPLRLGDVVSVAVEQARPRQVLVLVNHTIGDGTVYLEQGSFNWSNRGLVGTGLGIVVLSGLVFDWWAALAALVFTLVFWLAVGWLACQRGDQQATEVSFLLDRDYFLWHAERRREGCAP